MASPTARISVRLKVAARPIVCGKAVLPFAAQLHPCPQRMPCSPSLHHSKLPIPSAGTPDEVVESRPTLSAGGIRPTRSAARAAKDKLVLQNAGMDEGGGGQGGHRLAGGRSHCPLLGSVSQ
jgi:hypothetical protein